MTRDARIYLPHDVARCSPGLPCVRQTACARGSAVLPHSWATVTDFTTLVNGMRFDPARCEGFMAISYTRPDEVVTRKVHPPLGG